MRVATATGDIDVSWWIEVKSRAFHLAVDRYVDEDLADLPDSFPIESRKDTLGVLKQLGALTPEEDADRLWTERPS